MTIAEILDAFDNLNPEQKKLAAMLGVVWSAVYYNGMIATHEYRNGEIQRDTPLQYTPPDPLWADVPVDEIVAKLTSGHSLTR